MNHKTAIFESFPILNEGEQLYLFDNFSEMNAENLKYKRRTFRTISKTKYQLDAPRDRTSETMQKVRSSKTCIENLLEVMLKSENISFAKPEQIIANVVGKPDFILPKYRIAIFCDGDFWHGFNQDKTNFNSNNAFWQAKITRNIERDTEVNGALNVEGWDVLRFWEHELKNEIYKCIDKIKSLVRQKAESKAAPDFTFLDLFAGIGGFRIPLEELGGKCVGFSEIDKNAISTYKMNFCGYGNPEELELGDITKVASVPITDVDLVVGGVPCQAWSIAGKQGAFDDPRGKLWHTAINFVKMVQPKAFIFENVKGLIDPRNQKNLSAILKHLTAAGYLVKAPQLLNSYDFGLPQNRDRIFITGIRKDLKQYFDKFSYPLPISEKVELSDLTAITRRSNYQKKQFLPSEIFGAKIPLARNRFQEKTELNDFFVFSDVRNGHTTIHSWDLIRTTTREKEICLTILKNRRKKLYGDADGNPIPFNSLKLLIENLEEAEMGKLVGKKILKKVIGKGYEFVNSKISAGINGIYRVYLPESKIFSTLTATGSKDFIALKSISGDNPESYKQNFIKEIIQAKQYRQISAKEAGLLQGFPSWFAIHPKDSVAKKQFGNAVSTAVVYHLANQIKQTGLFVDSSDKEMNY